MQAPDINEDSIQAVKNLKSKFERLASEPAPYNNYNAPTRPTMTSTTTTSFLLTAPAHPRPRATSNSQGNTPVPPESISLRLSSSSSDLKNAVKRAPPPPPPARGSKIVPSPSPSPAPSLVHRPPPSPPSSKPTQREDEISVPSVAALKSRFCTQSPSPPPSQLHTPRQSVSSLLSLQAESPKPAIPPRPPSILVPIKHTISTEGLPITMSKSPEEEMIPSQTSSKYTIVSTLDHAEADTSSTFNDSGSSSNGHEQEHDAPSIPRTSRSAPPPPPPRHNRASRSPTKVEQPQPHAWTSLPASKATSPPPPLPQRRPTVLPVQDAPQPAAVAVLPPPLPPPIPSRPISLLVPNNNIEGPTSAQKKPLGQSRLPPPPTRTIGLGDKLPPARRPSTPSSDDESGDEDEPKTTSGQGQGQAQTAAIDTMPDSSQSSRRPPVLGFRDSHLHSPPRVHVHPLTGCVAVSGSYVVSGHGHNVKIYDLAVSDAPAFSLDPKDLGLPRDAKFTCVEVRPSSALQESGCLVWLGTREGHIVEVDLRTGVQVGVRWAAHVHPITHIFRHGACMVSLDESGKALVFAPDENSPNGAVVLATTVTRVVRTTDKQDFAKMVDGKLWTAARGEQHQHPHASGSAPAAAQRLPILRVYDVFNPASTGRSLLPTEHAGAVTSACVLPSQPGMAFVGHEEGFISLWDLTSSDDGYPRCVEVVRVAVSDVLSLEGVNDRLWAGSRNGMITAYDVSVKPWVVTNCWAAHPGLPVQKLMVNYFALERVGRLCVASIGRDEQLRLWDGLLGLDWVDKELAKHETSYSSFQDLSVLIVSWNCDSARPDALTGEENVNFLNDALHSVPTPPDVIVFGFQEVIDLESRKMVAKNVLLGGKKRAEDGGLSDKVTGAYKRWYDRLVLAVRAAMPRDTGYSVLHSESLVGLFSCVFVRGESRAAFEDVSITTIKRGMGGRYGNKGGIVARFVIGDSSICFINCHLAAGQNAVRRRNADIASMLEDKAVFAPTQHPLAYVGGGDGSMVLDHEFVILNGDLNYRIDHRRDAIIAAINAGDLSSLLLHDQLLREIKFNRACRLRGFSEGVLTFNPTYKYDRRSDTYDSSEKHRSPAWCDRILWRARVPARVRQTQYRRYEANVSDHRPISAAFSVTVKTFDRARREQQKAVAEARWVDEQDRLLVLLGEFYSTQALI